MTGIKLNRCTCEESITYDMGDGDYPAEWRVFRLMTGQTGYRVACPYCLDMTAMYSTREAAAKEWNEWKTGEEA